MTLQTSETEGTRAALKWLVVNGYRTSVVHFTRPARALARAGPNSSWLWLSVASLQLAASQQNAQASQDTRPEIETDCQFDDGKWNGESKQRGGNLK